MLQFAGELFVGVEEENPVVRSKGSGVIFLVGVIGERAEENFRAGVASDFLSAVGAAAIDNNDFIGDALSGAEHAGKIFLFVLGDDADAQAVHWSAGSVSHGRKEVRKQE